MKRWNKAFFTSAVSLLLSACVSNMPRDVIVSEVGIVSRESLDKIVEKPFHESWLIDKFLVVGLSTDTDLIQYAQGRGYPLSVNRWFCEQKSTPIFGSGLYAEEASLYTQTIDLEKIKFMSVSQKERSGKNLYYAVVPLSISQDIEIYGRPERKGAVFYGRYNLESYPRDLCFQVGGYSYGFGFKSNLAKLPASTIQGVVHD
uniref:hypothetical protein n=1 Tax=Microbulbifer agarilyticus TaxID=260552 RepID=UPI0011104E6B|nr:hypothetical protein [Microbulbifer agarilyticus]